MIDDKIARQLVAFGALLAVTSPAAAASLEQQGQYLAEAGGCAARHTAEDAKARDAVRRGLSPRNIAGAIEEGQELTGGRIDVW